MEKNLSFDLFRSSASYAVYEYFPVERVDFSLLLESQIVKISRDRFQSLVEALFVDYVRNESAACLSAYE